MLMYNKNDAIMTRGLAIISMLVLHLFCATGQGVLGTPLLWVNETTPVVYYFGFFAEICVPLYSMCAGYARFLMQKNQKLSFKGDISRILRLIVNYWIVLLLFCAVGLIIGHNSVPGNLTNFIKSIFLLHSYNGAWWFLSTYILLLIIPACIMLFPVNKIKNSLLSFAFCFGVDVLWYLLFKFNILSDLDKSASALSFIGTEMFNLIGVLPYFWAGAFLCKYNTVDYLKDILNKHIPKKFQNIFLLSAWGLFFLATVIIHKAVLIGAVAVVSFLIFNLTNKSSITEKTFLFLGKHSTNIWLTHMFFYAIMFKELLISVKYPLFIFLFLIALCVATSYIIMGVQYIIYNIPKAFKAKKKIKT